MAAYWLYNGSDANCALPSGLRVDFLDSRSRVLISRDLPDGGATLPAHTPAPGAAPVPNTVAWFAVVFTRLDTANGGGVCRTEDTLVPASLRVTIGDAAAPLTVATTSPDGERMEICREAVGLLPVAPFS